MEPENPPVEEQEPIDEDSDMAQDAEGGVDIGSAMELTATVDVERDAAVVESVSIGAEEEPAVVIDPEQLNLF